MAKTILIEFEGRDNVSKVAETVANSVKRIGTQTTAVVNNLGKSSKTIANSVKNVGVKTAGMAVHVGNASTKTNKALTDLGSQLRYMSLVAGIAAAGAISLANSFVTAAKEIQDAQLKLGVYALSAGENLDVVNKAAQDLYSTGLVPLTDASTAYANLLATGMGLEKSTKLIDTFMNAIVVGKESINDTFGEALVKATLGIRIFQERQADASGINTQFNKVFLEFGRTIGKTTDQLSNAEKHEALFLFYMKEGTRFTGAAELATMTLSGTISKLSATYMILKATMGNALLPAFGTLTEMLQKVSKSITGFARNFPALTSVIVVGGIAMTVFTAALAGLGALIPLVQSGIGGLTNIMALLNAATLLSTLKVVALGIAVGALVYILLKVTGQWDKWINSMKNLTVKMKDLIKPMAQVGDVMAENNEKLGRQLKTLDDSFAITIRNFQEGMAEWVRDHDKTTSKIRTQIEDLERDYKAAMTGIKESFSDAMSNLEIDHARKTEDIQQQLDEEVSKGIWADQTRIRELRKSLKRENEDYSRSKDKNEDRREEDLADETEKYDSRLTELQSTLVAAEELERKHATIISKYRTYPLLDEIEMRERALVEKTKQYEEERSRLSEDSAAQVNSLGEVEDAINNIGNALNLIGNEGTVSAEKIKNGFANSLSTVVEWSAKLIAMIAVPSLIWAAFKTFFDSLAAGFTLSEAAYLVWAAKLSGALPWITLSAVAVSAFYVIKKELEAYHKDFEKTLGLFDIWQVALDDRATQLITLRKEGKITSDAFQTEMQKIKNAQQGQIDQLDAFINTQFPTWVNFLADTWGAAINFLIGKARDLVTSLNVAREVSSGMQTSTAPHFGSGSIYTPTQTPALSSYLSGGAYSNPNRVFQEGGVVPGAPSSPVPILAHGGETVLPYGVSPINININNPTVREESDIRKIADAVRQVLSREQALKRYK